jgi:hypothetical protein
MHIRTVAGGLLALGVAAIVAFVAPPALAVQALQDTTAPGLPTDLTVQPPSAQRTSSSCRCSCRTTSHSQIPTRWTFRPSVSDGSRTDRRRTVSGDRVPGAQRSRHARVHLARRRKKTRTKTVVSALQRGHGRPGAAHQRPRSLKPPPQSPKGLRRRFRLERGQRQPANCRRAGCGTASVAAHAILFTRRTQSTSI